MNEHSGKPQPPVKPFAEHALLLKEMVKHPLRTAALAPSSPHLARHLADSLALEQAEVVVELGIGTGGLTQAVLPRLRPGARYLGVERNPLLIAAWRSRFPDWEAAEGNVADLGAVCEAHGLARAHTCCIVSGLPWASFPEWLQEKALDEIASVLRPGGQISTFGYHIGLMMPAGQRFYRLLPARFQKVERLPWVWRNLPPAFVLRCTR